MIEDLQKLPWENWNWFSFGIGTVIAYTIAFGLIYFFGWDGNGGKLNEASTRRSRKRIRSIYVHRAGDELGNVGWAWSDCYGGDYRIYRSKIRAWISAVIG